MNNESMNNEQWRIGNSAKSNATTVAIALRALLDNTPDIRLVAESRRGSEVAALVRRTRPDVLLLDLFIEPEFDALSVVRDLRADFPDLRICLLSAYLEPFLVRHLLQAGVESMNNGTMNQ
jgi:DNA-binding NarL/FixJ family response regulator